MASTDSLLTTVQAKFSIGENVVSVLDDATLVCPEWERSERILVIVECGDEKALFVIYSSSYPPKFFSDLSIERVLPIDKEFKCEIDDGKRNSETVVYLNIISHKSKFLFELKPGKGTSELVDQLFLGIEHVELLRNPQHHAWLQKYMGFNKDSAELDSPDIIVPRQSIAQGATPIAARESIIKYQMQLKEDDYTNSQVFQIYTGTWNVNGQPPTVSLHDWLGIESQPPDIYAIGFQELDLSKEAFLFDFTARETEWYNAVMAAVDKRVKYYKVDLVRLVGMMLIVLVRDNHREFVKNVASDTVGTGIMGKMGNKGGVSIRFELHNTSLCFVNSHLAAHVEEFERRNQDFHDICGRTQFTNFVPTKGIKDHDQIFWIGDLNYRITEMDHNTVKKLLDINNIRAVLGADQLRKQCDFQNVFSGYMEGRITFMPTYKYDPGTDNWDSSEKTRAPAWCDRIFWKGEIIKQLCYRSHPKLNISDHKPVSAIFESQIRVVNHSKYRKVHEEVIKKLDKLENEFLPHVTVDPTEIVFNTVKYLEPQIREVCIANTGQVPVQFEFIKKLEESTYCKDWLNVEPYMKCIRPGEKCDVKLEVFVNKKSAYKMNSGEDKLYDILVLHLDGGKDIFITVTGTYERSCFGSSIEALVHIKVPIREIPVGKLMELEINRHQSVYCSNDWYSVPKEIWFLVDHIYRHGLKEQSLFEQPGLHAEVLLIRDWLDNGSSSPLPGSVHSVAEALLLLLDSTAEPIIPYNHHSACLNVSTNYLQCKEIVMQLPEQRKNVFLYLCSFLQEVLNHSSDNGVDSKSLATLFGSIFLRDPPNAKSHRKEGASDRKKSSFVHHFLINDQSDFILGR